MTFKELLKEQDFSYERLAKNMGIGQWTIRKWIDGKAVPSKENLFRIAVVLSVDINTVLNSFDLSGV